jgi:hypothetical protein
MLTILGVVIGIAAVATMVLLGQSGSQRMHTRGLRMRLSTSS